jgi:TolB protein
MFLSNDNYEIYRMDADGSHQQQLTSSPWIDSSPSWSPDGSQIAFVGTQAIQVMDADGSNQRRLTHNAIDLAPSWSPDGQHILFMSLRDGYQKFT